MAPRPHASRGRPRPAPAGSRRRNPPPPPVPDARRRLLALLVVLGLVFVAVVVRLGTVQGSGGRKLALVGRAQRLRSAVIPAERGTIVDRNGEPLAISTRRRTVWADPQAVRDPAGAARALAPVLHDSEASIRDRLTGPGSFVYLARKVEDPVADAVAALHLAGISLLDEPKRVEPADALAGPVLGHVGLDDEGLSGLELQFQRQLAGRAGQLVVEKDPAGRDIAAGVHELTAPTRGDQLVLTVDRSMQYATERALADQIVSSHARGGIAVVMEPRTGEVLAMANLVAGEGGGPPVPSRDNMAVTRVYEPGSVNKMITVSAALEERVARPADTLVVPDHLNVADATFHDAEPHATESMTVGRVVAESSNVGTIMIAQRLGRDRIDRYLRAFGLADPTDLRFPGESGGIMPAPADWSGTSIATVPVGQGVAVTALQMLGAYNTIANGGVYVAPSLVRRVVDAKGRPHDTRHPPPRRVVSETTAAEMTTMLQQVVTDGTGRAAAVPGYTVAGKTGTAQKPRSDGAGYKEGAYLATFAGFLPAQSPRLSAIVVLDEPTPIFGGLVSAPVFSQVAGRGVRLLSVPPDVAPSGAVLSAAGAPSPSPQAAPATTVAGTTPRRPTTTLGRAPTSRP